MKKIDEIVNDYHCYDQYSEGCDCDCEYCKRSLRNDLMEMIDEIEQIMTDEYNKLNSRGKRCCRQYMRECIIRIRETTND